MKNLIILFLLSWTIGSYAQTNIVQEGSHIVIIDNDSTTVREYNTAIEMLLNARLIGKTATVIMAPIRVDLDETLLIKTDTIYVNSGLTQMQVIDTIDVKVFTWSIQSDLTGYFKSLDCKKLYQVEKDSSVRLGQGHWDMKLERTKEWIKCETTYKFVSADSAFQITKQPNVYDDILNMEANEYCQAWFDIEDSAFPQQIKHSDVEQSFRWADHNMRISDWDPGSEYTITGYAVNQAGDTIVSAPQQYTRPDVDVLPLEGFKYYTVWVPTSDLTSTSAKLRTWTTEQCSIQAIIGTSKFNMVEYPMDNGLNASHPGYWQHGRTIEGLEPNTRYYFELTNVNAEGVQIRSSIHSFKTLP